MSETRITLAEVEHVARLARLDLAPEREGADARASSTRSWATSSSSGAVDTAGVEPTSHVLPLANVMREDEVRPSYPAEAMLANAPDAPTTGSSACPASWRSER